VRCNVVHITHRSDCDPIITKPIYGRKTLSIEKWGSQGLSSAIAFNIPRFTKWKRETRNREHQCE
jgi:hypothetical protein